MKFYLKIVKYFVPKAIGTYVILESDHKYLRVANKDVL